MPKSLGCVRCVGYCLISWLIRFQRRRCKLRWPNVGPMVTSSRGHFTALREGRVSSLTVFPALCSLRIVTRGKLRAALVSSGSKEIPVTLQGCEQLLNSGWCNGMVSRVLMRCGAFWAVGGEFSMQAAVAALASLCGWIHHGRERAEQNGMVLISRIRLCAGLLASAI